MSDSMRDGRCRNCQSPLASTQKVYCSRECYVASRRETRVCPACGEAFVVKRSSTKRSCSKSCGAQSPRSRARATRLRGSQFEGVDCSVVGCPRPAKHGKTQPLCHRHYDLKRSGREDWNRPIRDKGPNMAGCLSSDGYVYLTFSSGRIAQHRWLAEKLLGRPLPPGASVHHRNGVRHDNLVHGPFKLDASGNLVSGNLEIWVDRPQPSGQRVGDRLDDALRLLETWPELLSAAHLARLRHLLNAG